jgi:hypothetical protein
MNKAHSHKIIRDSGEENEGKVVSIFFGAVPREGESISYAGQKYYVNMVSWILEQDPDYKTVSVARVFVRKA